MPAYHYTAIFPRRTEAPRQAWPIETIDRFAAIDGVFDVVFTEATAAWIPAGAALEETRLETSRRLVDVYARTQGTPEARATEAAIRELLLELAGDAAAGQITLVREELEDIERVDCGPPDG